MSDLQIALAVLGILVIAAVYAFNVWQERKLRKKLEHAFGGDREDVLLKKEPAATGIRIEPRLTDGSSGEDDGAAAVTSPVQTSSDVSPDGADPAIEYVIDIHLKDPPRADDLRALQSQISAFGKPARLLGWDAGRKAWCVLERGGETHSTRLQAALQLVDRAGPVHAPQLGGFFDAVRSWSARHGAEVESEDQAVALDIALSLDALCGNVDIAIGLNVVAQPGATFTGEQIATAAAEAGFELEADGQFRRYDPDDNLLFVLENHENEAFATDHLASMQTPGLTLLLDVPRVADGEAALDEMAQTAGTLAAALGGFVVDDNRVALQPAGLERIKLQLRNIHQNMAAHDIPAGSARAQRLFA